MALLTNSNTLNTVFTPAVGVFRVQCSAGTAQLQSRAVSGAAWVFVGDVNRDLRCNNEIAGTEYQFVSTESAVVVRADQ